ncbi:MAG: KH domain-containing protein [Candidatus Sumerlaeia bacterium]|nr:KH domain-containing protein [Candidatus Sumerlaeia bacterium]
MTETVEPSKTLRDLVEYIARELVDDPRNVTVTTVESDTVVVIELLVAKEDVGKVIGKGGQTAKALRKVISAAATKHKKKSVLDIKE